MANAKPALLSYDAFQACPHFNALDGLRAIAILLVLLHHTSLITPDEFLNTLRDNGRYGVSLFFLISGFVICLLLLRERTRTGRIDLRGFFGRRALRLLPLYYATLVLQAALVFLLNLHSPDNQELFRAKLPAYLFQYSNWLATGTKGPFFWAWALAAEVQFYIGFGLLLAFAARRVVVVAVIAALAVKASVFQSFGSVDAQYTVWRVVFSYQEAILVGVLVAFALQQRTWYERIVWMLGRGWVCALAGIAAVVWLSVHPMRSQSTWDAYLLYLLLAVSLIGIVARRHTPLLASAPVMYVGTISYGIYLLHMFVIYGVRKLPGGMQPDLCFVLSATGAILIAAAVHRWFEAPMARLLRPKAVPARALLVSPHFQRSG